MTTETRREYYLDKPERYWVLTGFPPFILPSFQEVEGVPVALPDWPEMDVFARKEYGRWRITDGVTGMGLHNRNKHPEGFSTIAEAVADACDFLPDFLQNLHCSLRNAHDKGIELYGLSPRYAFYPDEADE